MKKSYTALVLGTIIIFLFPISSSCMGDNNFLKGISFKLKGGYQYLHIGDLNTYMSIYNEAWEEYSEDYSVYILGKMQEFHHGSGIGGEVSFMLTSHLRGIIGIDYAYLKSESSIKVPDQKTTQIWKHKIESFPITFGIGYFFPLSKRSSFFLRAGIGYYFSRINEHYNSQKISVWDYSGEKKMHSSDFGVNGGFGFEYSISKNIYLTLECLGTYAKINKFRGKCSGNDQEGYYHEDKGIFYYWEELSEYSGYTAPHIYLGKPEPAWHRRNIREFVLDLSGVSLMLGLRVRLF
jgi:hypothetical protein